MALHFEWSTVTVFTAAVSITALATAIGIIVGIARRNREHR